MKTFVYFRKYSHYDAKFAAAKFVEECEIRSSIRINFKNAKIRKHSFRIQKAKFAHACIFIIKCLRQNPPHTHTYFRCL